MKELLHPSLSRRSAEDPDGPGSTRLGKTTRKGILVGLVLLLLLTSWLGALDRRTEEYIDGALTKALATYASIRVINGSLSFLMSGETTANVSLLGTGGSVAAEPARVLEPLDDLAEEFSDVVKFASISLVAQKVLIEIFSSVFFKLLLTVTGLCLILYFLLGVSVGYPLVLKAFLFTFFLRFCLLFSFGASQIADQAFLARPIDEDSAKIAAIEREVEQARDEESALTPEEQQGIEERRAAIAGEADRIREESKEIARETGRLREELGGREEEVSRLREERSTLDRLNPLNKDPELDRATDARNRTRDELRHLLSLTEEKEDQLASLAEEDQLLAARLLGEEEQGFVDGLVGGIGSIAQRLDFRSIGQAVESLVDSGIRLMALFLLKVLLIPLACFYLFLKAFSLLWKVDLRERYAFLQTSRDRE
jgi:hypothetical protein